MSFMQQARAEAVMATAEERLVLCDLDCGGALEGRNIFRMMESVCQIERLEEGEQDGWMVKREGH